MKSVWNGKNKKILFLVIFTGMILLPGCDDSPTRPAEGFYSYQGYRDWWRIPLDYPYQIYVADSFEQGNFQKYDPSTLVAEAKGDVLIPEITAFAENDKYWLFKTGKCCFLFDIATQKVQQFNSEKELQDLLAQQKRPLPAWKKLAVFYKERWKKIDKITQRPDRGFFTQRQNYYGKRIPLKKPWQIVITENNAFISQYDVSQTISDRLPSQKHRKYLENIVAANYERCFAVFKQSNVEKPYGCLIYATGSVRNFATTEELDRFIKLNYPDSALPEMMELEKFYNLMWQAIEKIKQTDPQKLAY
jgi:hypothetical protein